MANRKDAKGRVLKAGESQRKDGTYMYRYTDIRGKRQSVYACDLKKLREKEKVVQKAIDSGVNYSNGEITVLELVDRYLATKKGIQNSTMIRYRGNRNVISQYAFSQRKIRDVKISDAKLFCIALHEDGRSFGSVQLVLALLIPAFKMACDEDCISKNPFSFSLSDVVPNDRHSRVALSSSQQESIFCFVKNSRVYSRYYDMLNVLLWTGLRISEFCGLTVDDIDFENQKINVNKQLTYNSSDYKCHITHPKTKSGIRSIPITSKVYQSLKNLVDRARQSNIINMVDGYCGFIALKRNGKVMMLLDADLLFRRIKDAYNKANPHTPINEFTPHMLRHTFCTNMVDSGLDVKSLQYLMGHANANVTLNIYSHTSYDSASKHLFDLLNDEKAS